MIKTDQIEVIKFLKSPEYQGVDKLSKNRTERTRLAFETLYMGDDYTGSGEAKYSEIYMHSQRAKMLQDKIDEIKGQSAGASLVRKMFSEQIDNIKSHFYGITNSLGMSKDVAIFTQDDVHKAQMINETNLHLFVIGLMNPTKQGDLDLSEEEKLSIYENPEEFFKEEVTVDDEIEIE